ncbi:hypothetical protein AAKU55_005442 [Oxalobacteraceae bacterium GrIS 1.11]
MFDNIEEMHTLAANEGGLCLSPTYGHSEIHLQWQCIEGDVWESTAKQVRVEYWCRECRRIELALKRELERKKKKERFSVRNML